MTDTAKPAGFWIRLAAYILDGIILLMPIYIITGALFAVFAAMTSAKADVMVALIGVAVMYILITLLMIAAYVVFHSSSWQATPGKRLLNIYVGRYGDLSPISKTTALWRYAVFSGPSVLLVFSQVFLLVAPYDSALPADMTPQQIEWASDIYTRAQTGQEISTEDRILSDAIMLGYVFTTLPQEERKKLATIQYTMNKGTPLMDKDRKFLQQLAGKDNAEGTDTELMDAVYKAHGKAPSGGMIIISIINVLAFLYWIALVIMVAARSDKRGPHDLLAKTRVVYGRPQKAAQ